MRQRFVFLILMAMLTTTFAQEKAAYTFEAGKGLGPLSLGQTPETMLKALSGWTYETEGLAIGEVYYFPKGQSNQFLCGFSKENLLTEITVLDQAFRLKGMPTVGPGASMGEIRKRFGIPSTDTVGEYGGNWDYNERGICFHFVSDHRDPPRYGVGLVESISLYPPGKSRFGND